MSVNELQMLLSLAASQVKLACGVGNNAAWACCLEAHDMIKRHPNYKQTVKQKYKQALSEFHAYERHLLFNTQNRMFRLEDMSPATRKKYGDITDREYYDFWASTGSTAYAKHHNFVTSLCNKYRLSLQAHGVRNAELLAWPMTASAMLGIAHQIYLTILQVLQDEYKIDRKVMLYVFGQFDLSRVRKCWEDALIATNTKEFELDDLEKKNIKQGIQTLFDIFSDTSMHLKTTIETSADFDDIFRTKGELKKAQREISELEQEITEEEIKRNYERRREQITKHRTGRGGADIPCG